MPGYKPGYDPRSNPAHGHQRQSTAFPNRRGAALSAHPRTRSSLVCVSYRPSRIVETNPRKFRMDASELGDRKAFIARTRQSVKEMKDDMSSPRSVTCDEGKSRKSLLGGGSRAGGGPGGRYGRLEQEMDMENSRYIADTHAQQQLIVRSQDEQLELVSGSLGVLKHMSERIGNELDDQDRMLGDFSQELEVTQSRMDGVLKKLAKVSRMTSDRRQWIAILVLLGLVLLVLILFFTL